MHQSNLSFADRKVGGLGLRTLPKTRHRTCRRTRCRHALDAWWLLACGVAWLIADTGLPMARMTRPCTGVSAASTTTDSSTATGTSGTSAYSLATAVNFPTTGRCAVASYITLSTNTTSTGVAVGNISTQVIPLIRYGPSQKCVWTLSAPAGMVIEVAIASFALECGFDFLRVFDGPTTSLNTQMGKMSGTRSGSLGYTASENVLTSSSNALTLWFSSDSGVEETGFRATYALRNASALCTSTECQPGGVCVNGTCQCSVHFRGTYCQTGRGSASRGCGANTPL